MMKNLKYIYLCLIAVLLASCNKDGDILTAGANGDVLLNGSGDIVLDFDRAEELALTIYWTDNGKLTLSDPEVAAPDNATANTIQLSASESFDVTVDQLMNEGVYQRQYTVYELNALLGRLGFEGGVSKPLYIRVKSELGANIAATYSNTITINVTPYVIDMTVAFILDKDKADTGLTLNSETANGDYKGFMGVGAWYNFFLQEGEGSVWGNIGDDGGGVAFKMSNNDEKWNFWFPGLTGCYYVDLNTTKAEWSALYIPTLAISGDVNGEMVYNKADNKWVYIFSATKAGDITFKISGTGKLYNVSTGTDDALAIDTPVAFGMSGSNITFGETASNITVSVPAAGEMSVVLNLSNPKSWVCEVVAGGDTPVEVAKYLYLSGIDDGISGSWTFDNFITLYNEDELSYAGVCNVNSLWGYKFYTEKDNWDSAYGLGEGDFAAGTLVAASEVNLPASTPGLYLIQASMKKLTYFTVAIGSVQCAGINDDWTMIDMTPSATTGEFTATVNITADAPWGFKIYLNQSWDYFFGGSDGSLSYSGNGLTYDSSMIGSTCLLTVDLCKGTYSLTKK
ncbi:MAG: DUF5114 domain-containing protein [Muribaculaceae bacterium]|nr:DUF5114 domain-containing protein [Muribaculaceae bacterium]